MARDFNGTTDDITNTGYAAIDDIYTGGGTLMVWLNPDTTGEGTTGRVICRFEGTFPNRTWDVNITPSGSNGLDFFRDFSTTTGRWRISSIPLDTLQHYAVTYDDSSVSNDPNIYLDGSLQSESEESTPVGTAVADVSTNDIVIGDIGNGTRTWDGLLAYVVLWDTTVPTTHIAAVAGGVHPFAIINESQQLHMELFNDVTEPNFAVPIETAAVDGTTAVGGPPVELIETYM